MTHSTGFVLPSYMVKVGLVNLRGRLVFSISKKKKGDWDICCKFLLIASHTEVDSVTGIWELETIMCWETGLLCLSLSCSSLLFYLGGEETILSLWGICSRSPWGWIIFLSLFLVLSPSTCSAPQEWLGVGLWPLQWWSTSSLWQSNSLSPSTSLYNTATCSLSLSYFLSLQGCKGPSVLVAGRSPCGRGLGGHGASLWTSNLIGRSTWTDFSETLIHSKWDGPFRDWWTIKSKPTFEPTA